MQVSSDGDAGNLQLRSASSEKGGKNHPKRQEEERSHEKSPQASLMAWAGDLMTTA